MLRSFFVILLLSASPLYGLGEQLKGKLVQVDGYRLTPSKLPKDYRWVVFYYTASWCPNCHAIKKPMIKVQSELEEMHAGICFVWVSLDYTASEAARYYAKSGYRGLAIKPGIKPHQIPGAEDALKEGLPSLRIYQADGTCWKDIGHIPGTDIVTQLKLLQQAAQAP